jgi:hypothetical protein
MQLILVVVMGGAYLMGWYMPEVPLQGLAILVLIAGVYGGVMFVIFQQQERTAKDLNNRLRKYQGKKNEEE